MRILLALITFLSVSTLVVSSCSKDPENNNTGNNDRLSYGDTVFYVKSQTYVISPNVTEPGTYSAFPENLLIDPVTGRITVSIMGKGDESQTGLKYKIKFQAANSGKVDSTYITLGGINYLDQVYYLSRNDSIIRPVYNANINKQLPSGTYGINPDSRLSINPVNGEININECIRKGMFDLPLEHGEWEEVTITYKSNDASNSATNSIDIALYYYDSEASIPSNVSAAMRAHQSQVLGVPQVAVPITTGPIDNDLPDNLAINRPRPPCVIIVGL